jgi:hypothetical protein
MNQFYEDDDFYNYSPKDRRGYAQDEGRSTKLKDFNGILFETITSINFCVDGAIGLPVSSSATRVTARLLASDRTQVAEASPPYFCDLDSDVLNPQFDLQMNWKGETKLFNCSFVILFYSYIPRECVTTLIDSGLSHRHPGEALPLLQMYRIRRVEVIR